MTRLRIWFYRRFYGIALDRDERPRADAMAMRRIVELGRPRC